MTETSSSPLDSFVSQFGRDEQEGRIRPLHDYLEMFPGEDDAVAEKYLALKKGGSARRGPPADRIGHYRLLEELGRGGQAIVYLAEDTQIHGRKVAVKVLKDPSLLSEGALERFRREAEVASKLEHPGICPVYEAGIDGARPYIVMRYVKGHSLAERIQSSRETPETAEDASGVVDLDTIHLPKDWHEQIATDTTPTPTERTRPVDVMKAVWLFEQASRALHAAHEVGIIHRDIKPANIMVTSDGRPVLMDFGLAKEVDGPAMTLTGELFGTPAYMSPEQLLAEHLRVDRRTDVWSLGVTLYECLTLRRPFDAPTREGLYQAIQNKEPPDPRSLNAAVPSDLRVVLEAALDKDRDRRYQTALDLAEDLRRVREYEPIAAKPASAWIKLKRWAQRNPALAGSLTAGGLVLIVGLALIIWQWTRAEANLARYGQMSDVARVEDLKARASKLWPRRPHMLPAMSRWLEEARELYARLPLHESALQELGERAALYDSAQQEADAERRREIHAELFDGIAAKKMEVGEAEQEVTGLRTQIAEFEKKIEEEENERIITRYEIRKERCEAQVEQLGDRIPALREELSTLEEDPRLSERLTWELSDPTNRWRHQVLSEMVRELRCFDGMITDVEARWTFADAIEERSVKYHRAAWNRFFEELKTNPRYSASEDLRAMKPQIGFVPLGIDRDSGLWEFWHVGSGDRPMWEGADWAADPSADPRGEVQITEASGIVLVLLPGGTFWMGATREIGARNHDPEAELNESPVNEVELGAFFMAKYELNQAQWLRLMGDNPSAHRAGGPNNLGGTITTLHPVTNVNWGDCREAIRRWDLELPTEARWEYACRAGTSTVHWCGDSVASIQDRRAGNIADRTASERSRWACTMEVHDGHVVHAPVGTFAANAFGLHDVLGNVSEWCADRHGLYEQPARPGDGLRDDPGSRTRFARDGNFYFRATIARSAKRITLDPSYGFSYVGCRPTRGITK